MAIIINSTVIAETVSSIQQREVLRSELIKFKLDLEVQIKGKKAQLELFNTSIKAKIELDGSSNAYLIKKRTNIINELSAFNIELEDTDNKIDKVNSKIKYFITQLHQYLILFGSQFN